ncbi:hypothetical protein BV25DRAFT_1853259 [Artomyces pyxidatus]|uniref:Uncharacterized protein n=1 Tax=Artomyces pyxidatus TaxID=48021 RepID=A0ACB8T7Q7_9AGAM|nr:hypothetical protein BV25DRAFT_1853259 [Artomyces pyxidatus]
MNDELHRSDSDSSVETLVEGVKNSEPWLNDGNIIIRTRTGPQRSLYKVHKSVLALHCHSSSNLLDTISHTELEAAEHDLHDGVPIVDLEDADNDVKSFLKVLYHPEESQRHLPRSFNGRFHMSTFPPTYAGVLRLATKYRASSIREIIVRALKMEGPTELSRWDHQRSLFNLSASADPAHAIVTARESDVPVILPTAFYHLLVVQEMQDPDPPAGKTVLRADLSILTADDLRKLTLGRAALRSSFFNAVFEKLKLIPRKACQRRERSHVPSWVPYSACCAGVICWLHR